MRLSTRFVLLICLAALSAAVAGHFLLAPSLAPAASLAALIPGAALVYGLGREQGKRRLSALADALTRQLQDQEQAKSAADVTIASLRDLFDRNPVPMYVYDQASLRFLDVNDSAVTQYGYGRERFLAMTLEDIRSPEEITPLRAFRVGMILTDGAAGVWDHLKADGTVITVEIIRRAVLFGDRPAMLAAAVDVTHACRVERELRDSQTRLKAFVTEQKNAEQALRESEAQLRRSREHLAHAQRTSDTGSWELDRRSQSVEWSDELFRVLGLSRGQVSPGAGALAACFRTEDRERIGNWLDLACAGATAPAIEGRVVLADGKERWVRLDAAVLRDAWGEIGTIVGTVESITQRKLAELELRDNEVRLRRSQDHLKTAQRVAAIGSFEHRFDTSVLEWSEETYRIFGIEAGTPMTVDAEEAMVLEEDVERLRDNFRQAREGEPVSAIEYRIRRPDGVVRTLHRESATLRDAAGAPIGIIGVCRDVTELRAEQRRSAELETQLQHVQRMEALGTLAGGIAHDLNNTLLPVMILADAVQRKLPAGSAEAERLQLIRQAGDRARGLVRQILAFSRREDPNRVVLDLAALVHQSMSLVRAGVPTTVRIEEQIDDVSPVLGDAGQLHQVLLNLIANAIDAIGDSIGTISLALKNEAQSAAGPGATEGPCVHFSVADTGCGMDEPTLKRIFEPFFTTKAVGQGTGLGLSVVHGIVASHGGRIEATSGPGEGTRFDIFLPALGAERSAHDKEIAA